MEHKEIWQAAQTPPKHALKEIIGGRLKGMTDIKPQWRYEKATELFGPCGIGWWYTVDRLSVQHGAKEEMMAFAEISLYYRYNDVVSQPIPGQGGAMMTALEKNGLYNSDECFKMAITDALSVAFKMLGFGADVYMGQKDSKYSQPAAAPSTAPTEAPSQESDVLDAYATRVAEIKATGGDMSALIRDAKEVLTADDHKRLIKIINGG